MIGMSGSNQSVPHHSPIHRTHQFGIGRGGGHTPTHTTHSGSHATHGGVHHGQSPAAGANRPHHRSPSSSTATAPTAATAATAASSPLPTPLPPSATAATAATASGGGRSTAITSPLLPSLVPGARVTATPSIGEAIHGTLICFDAAVRVVVLGTYHIIPYHTQCTALAHMRSLVLQ
jgi:hypothetical protein